MKVRAFEWFESWPQEVQIGLIFVVCSWFVFMITMPFVKRTVQRKWRKLKAEQCRRKQKFLWKILFWVHAIVLSLAYFGLDYAHEHSKVYGKYVDMYLSYFFVIVSFCIFLQIIYEAVKEYVVGRFGPEPQNKKWKKLFDYFKSSRKNIKSSAVYQDGSEKLKRMKRFIYFYIYCKIKNKLKSLF